MQETEISILRTVTAKTVEHSFSPLWGGFIATTCWSLASSFLGPTSWWANGEQEVTQAEPPKEGPPWNLPDTSAVNQGEHKTVCLHYNEI